LKPGQIYRFKADSEDTPLLYLIVSHEDSGIVYNRMMPLTGTMAFGLTGPTYKDEWFDEHMELVYENIQMFLPTN